MYFCHQQKYKHLLALCTSSKRAPQKKCEHLLLQKSLIFDYFGKIPIPVGKEEQRQAIAQKVDEILACKKADAQADTQALEREIDALVYALYGLSEAEIAEVEAS